MLAKSRGFYESLSGKHPLLHVDFYFGNVVQMVQVVHVIGVILCISLIVVTVLAVNLSAEQQNQRKLNDEMNVQIARLEMNANLVSVDQGYYFQFHNGNGTVSTWGEVTNDMDFGDATSIAYTPTRSFMTGGGLVYHGVEVSTYPLA